MEIPDNFISVLIGGASALLGGVVTYTWKVRGFVSRVDSLEKSNTSRDERVDNLEADIKDELSQLKETTMQISNRQNLHEKNHALLVEKISGMSDVVTIKLDNLSNTIVESKEDHRGYQERTGKTLEFLGNSFLELSTQMKDMNSAIDRIDKK